VLALPRDTPAREAVERTGGHLTDEFEGQLNVRWRQGVRLRLRGYRSISGWAKSF